MIFFLTGSSDEFVSLWHIKRNSGKGWPSLEVKDSVIEGYIGYPILQHYIIGRLPEIYWPYVGKILNIMYDILVGIAVYFVTQHLVSTLKINETIGGLYLPILAVLIYLTGPTLMPITARMRAISARSMGLLLTTMYFLLLGEILLHHSYILIPAVAILGFLIVLSSQFGLQAILFLSVILSFMTLSVLPVLIVLLIIGILPFLPFSNAGNILRHIWSHKRWYLDNWREGTRVMNRNRLEDLLKMSGKLFNDPKTFIEYCVERFTPTIALYSALPFFLLGVWWFVDNDIRMWLSSVPEIKYFWLLSVSSFFLFVIISVPVLGFLGQAERYFEYTTPFYSILFVLTLTQIPTERAVFIFWGVFFFQILAILFNFLWLNRYSLFDNYEQLDTEFDDTVSWFVENMDKSKILTVPLKLSYLFSILAERKDGQNRFEVYYRFIKRKQEKAFQYFADDMGGYEPAGDEFKKSISVLSTRPEELHLKYGITHLVIEKKYLDALRYTWNRDYVWLKEPLFENNKFMVFNIESER